MHHGLATLVLLTSCSALAETGCAPGAAERPLRSHHILVDTSGSIPTEVAERITQSVLEDGKGWITTARTGERLGLWTLSEESPYPAVREVFTMPALGMPAYVRKREVAAECDDWAMQALNGARRGLRRTPLLEALYFVSTSQDHPWSAVVYSDLMEDTAEWTSLVRRLGPDATTEDQIQAMLELCPPVRQPPDEVTLRTWPGVIAGGNAVREHERLRTLFVLFVQAWAPGARVHVESIN